MCLTSPDQVEYFCQNIAAVIVTRMSSSESARFAGVVIACVVPTQLLHDQMSQGTEPNWSIKIIHGVEIILCEGVWFHAHPYRGSLFRIDLTSKTGPDALKLSDETFLKLLRP